MHPSLLLCSYYHNISCLNLFFLHLKETRPFCAALCKCVHETYSVFLKSYPQCWPIFYHIFCQIIPRVSGLVRKTKKFNMSATTGTTKLWSFLCWYEMCQKSECITSNWLLCSGKEQSLTHMLDSLIQTCSRKCICVFEMSSRFPTLH